MSVTFVLYETFEVTNGPLKLLIDNICQHLK